MSPKRFGIRTEDGSFLLVSLHGTGEVGGLTRIGAMLPASNEAVPWRDCCTAGQIMRQLGMPQNRAWFSRLLSQEVEEMNHELAEKGISKRSGGSPVSEARAMVVMHPHSKDDSMPAGTASDQDASSRVEDAFPRSEAIRKLFTEIDRVGTGTLTRRDILLAIRQDPSKKQQLREIAGFPDHVQQEDGSRDLFEGIFQEMDGDDSNDLSFDEFQRYIEMTRNSHMRLAENVNEEGQTSNSSQPPNQRGPPPPVPRRRTSRGLESTTQEGGPVANAFDAQETMPLGQEAKQSRKTGDADMALMAHIMSDDFAHTETTDYSVRSRRLEDEMAAVYETASTGRKGGSRMRQRLAVAKLRRLLDVPTRVFAAWASMVEGGVINYSEPGLARASQEPGAAKAKGPPRLMRWDSKEESMVGPDTPLSNAALNVDEPHFGASSKSEGRETGARGPPVEAIVSPHPTPSSQENTPMQFERKCTTRLEQGRPVTKFHLHAHEELRLKRVCGCAVLMLRAESFDGSTVYADGAIVYDSAAPLGCQETDMIDETFPSLGGIVYSFWTVPTELSSVSFFSQDRSAEQDAFNAVLQCHFSIVSTFSAAECKASPSKTTESSARENDSGVSGIKKPKVFSPPTKPGRFLAALPQVVAPHVVAHQSPLGPTQQRQNNVREGLMAQPTHGHRTNRGDAVAARVHQRAEVVAARERQNWQQPQLQGHRIGMQSYSRRQADERWQPAPWQPAVAQHPAAHRQQPAHQQNPTSGAVPFFPDMYKEQQAQLQEQPYQQRQSQFFYSPPQQRQPYPHLQLPLQQPQFQNKKGEAPPRSLLDQMNAPFEVARQSHQLQRPAAAHVAMANPYVGPYPYPPQQLQQPQPQQQQQQGIETQIYNRQRLPLGIA